MMDGQLKELTRNLLSKYENALKKCVNFSVRIFNQCVACLPQNGCSTNNESIYLVVQV